MDKQTENKRLIERYPFLLPRHGLSEICSTNFVSTALDEMPVGWRTAFGEDICKEIMEELVRNNCVESYQILQIKEKYGELRWYSQGGTERIHREIVPEYEKMSRRICIQCGQPAILITKSWVAPWCNACAEQFPRPECVDGIFPSLKEMNPLTIISPFSIYIFGRPNYLFYIDGLFLTKAVLLF